MPLRFKITLALVITTLSGILIVAVLAERFTAIEFDNFATEQQQANFISNMASYYATYGSWENIHLGRGGLPLPPPPDENANDPSQERPPYPLEFMLLDVDGQVVISDRGAMVGETVAQATIASGEPIVVDGETVGYVVIKERFPEDDPLAEAYLERIRQLLLVAMVGATFFALLLSFLFARSLSKPLREIASAIQSISKGDLEQQVPVRSRDEVGQVAQAFNQMSADLSRSNRLRRQMMSDIAHELRTPLSVVTGYLASLSEGLLKPSPERFKIMHDEAQHLQRLVEDLRTMSLADAGELHLNRQQVTPEELLNITAATFTHQAEQKNINLVVNASAGLPMVYADPDRILQVLSNLMSNALRHTPEQGKITLAAATDANRQITMTIQDTGSGIAPEHLSHIFERFYSADAMHSREQEETGLGLAIAKSLVEAHGGTIVASSIEKEGTAMIITFDTLIRTQSASTRKKATHQDTEQMDETVH